MGADEVEVEMDEREPIDGEELEEGGRDMDEDDEDEEEEGMNVDCSEFMCYCCLRFFSYFLLFSVAAVFLGYFSILGLSN